MRLTSGSFWAVRSSAARERASSRRSSRGISMSTGESWARPSSGCTSATAPRARPAVRRISSRPWGRRGQPPSGSWRRHTSRRRWTLTSSACRSSTSRPGRTRSLACRMKRRRVEPPISMSCSSRHRLVAVAMTMSAAERSKTSGMKTSRESRTPSSISSCSIHWPRLRARLRPVVRATTAVCSWMVGSRSLARARRWTSASVASSMSSTGIPFQALEETSGVNSPRVCPRRRRVRACSRPSSSRRPRCSASMRARVVARSRRLVSSASFCSAS